MVKCARGNRPTYERELLNPRKNSNFYKTNQPGKGNNGGLGGLMEDLTSIQITTAIIDNTGARRSYKAKMDDQTSELLRLTLKERDAGAAVLGRAFA